MGDTQVIDFSKAAVILYNRGRLSRGASGYRCAHVSGVTARSMRYILFWINHKAMFRLKWVQEKMGVMGFILVPIGAHLHQHIQLSVLRMEQKGPGCCSSGRRGIGRAGCG